MEIPALELNKAEEPSRLRTCKVSFILGEVAQSAAERTSERLWTPWARDRPDWQYMLLVPSEDQFHYLPPTLSVAYKELC